MQRIYYGKGLKKFCATFRLEQRLRMDFSTFFKSPEIEMF